MSKWDKIVRCDSLQAFPCIADLHCIEAGDDQCEDPNFAPCPDPGRCALRPIYEEYLALRDVVAAELGHYSPTYRAEHWRIKAKMAATPEAKAMCMKNAAAWDALT